MITEWEKRREMGEWVAINLHEKQKCQSFEMCGGGDRIGDKPSIWCMRKMKRCIFEESDAVNWKHIEIETRLERDEKS